MSLLHLCNCLFFYEGKYRIDHLPNAMADFKRFYTIHNKPENITKNVRKDWAVVVQDLNDYSMKRWIFYTKYKENQVKNGILNMMKVLIKITGLDHRTFIDEINLNNLEQRLELLIQTLSLKKTLDKVEQNKSMVEVRLSVKEYAETGAIDNDKFEYFGHFFIIFKYLNKRKGFIRFDHPRQWLLAYTSFLNYIEPQFNLEDKENSNNAILSKIKYSIFEDKTLKANFETYLRKLFLHEWISTYELVILEKLNEFYQELNIAESIEKAEILSKIMNLILNNVFIIDEKRKMLFEKYSYLKPLSSEENK